MGTKSQEAKDAAQAANELLKLLNQFVKGANKEVKNLKRQQAQKRRNSLLADLVKVMQDRGASEQSIRKALPGLAEYLKYSNRALNSQASSKSENSQPAPTPEEEALGLFLSEIKAQQVLWLWEKRIPLGKI